MPIAPAIPHRGLAAATERDRARLCFRYFFALRYTGADAPALGTRRLGQNDLHPGSLPPGAGRGRLGHSPPGAYRHHGAAPAKRSGPRGLRVSRKPPPDPRRVRPRQCRQRRRGLARRALPAGGRGSPARSPPRVCLRHPLSRLLQLPGAHHRGVRFRGLRQRPPCRLPPRCPPRRRLPRRLPGGGSRTGPPRPGHARAPFGACRRADRRPGIERYFDRLHGWLSRSARPRTTRSGRPGQARRPHSHPRRRGSHARPARAPHRYGCRRYSRRGTHACPASAARPFREMGVVVRAPEIYVPTLRSTLERFGVPARFYFDSRLERHPVVRFLSGAIDAMLGGWDHARTLAVLRLAPRIADYGMADRFDFAVREQTPNAGLSGLRALLLGDEGQPRAGAERLLHKLDSLAGLEEWRGFTLTPRDWAARFGTLRHLFRPAPPPDPATHEFALQWRSQAAALHVFDEALADAASALDGTREIGIEDYWGAVKKVLRLKPLRLADGRRNVVHVMSVHEARQWVLPIVFVCGMVEKQFPQVHQQDPFFPDSARCRLNADGIRVRTAAESEREERALFSAATSRATMLVPLSYPEFDARAERNLPSIYLEDVLEPAVDAVPVRPLPRSLPQPRGGAEVAAPDLLDFLRRKTARMSPSALEAFLQCPFQYFTQRLVRLQTAPLRPEERLSFLEQGNIVHEVRAEWWREPRDVVPLFEQVFARHLEEEHIPDGYHTERLRNAMLDDLKRFTDRK